MTRATTTLRPDRETVVVALLAGTAGVAGSFAVTGFSSSFIGGSIAWVLARYLPGSVITVAIVVLGDLGEQLAVITALGLSIILVSIAVLLGLAIAHRAGYTRAGPLLAGVAGTIVTMVVSTAPIASLTAGLAIVLVLGTAEFLSRTHAPVSVSPARRRVLGGSISALFMIAAGGILGTQRDQRDQARRSHLEVSFPEQIRQEIPVLLSGADEKSFDIDGLEPLVSERFYQVDINAADPIVDADNWELAVTGAVAEERTYRYSDLLERTPENRFITLRCVGEQLNGTKMDNALWTGIPIMAIVDPAVPSDACCVMLRAADGFFEEFPLAALENGFLAYAMNGEALPRGHGYPVRALIPGHWGEINVKWLTEIELLEEEQDGYWERRGWHGTGPVNTVAKLHVVNHLDDGRMQVAGHAYAGTRGITRVEVSIDGGDAWRDARLSDPLPGADVWRQWEYTYDPPGRPHEVVVRATDGTGTIQPREDASPFPSGPSGWVARTVRQ